MNLFESYRALRDNAKAAMLGAIEIYNKPQFEYRSECFVILLINAWELLLKSVISKNRKRIYYPKLRDKPYITYDIGAALEKCKPFFPASIPYKAVCENIGRLVDYRNNAIHFYNDSGFEIVIYGLAQTSIVNFRDLMLETFEKDIADEVNLSLLPLSFGAPPDPIQFIKEGLRSARNPFVGEYLKLISDTTQELESENIDTGRFLTVFKVNLQSAKKLTSADVTAGVEATSPGGVLLVSKKVDPNISHPLLRMDIISRIGDKLRGIKFTTYTFEAIVWKYDIKNEPRFSWRSERGSTTTHYSNDLIPRLKQLSKTEITQALTDYRNHLRSRQSRS
jgi:hypothetical protein